MADSSSTPEERTELPTSKRLGQLRSEGAIFYSNEVTQVMCLLVSFYALTYLWPILFQQIQILFKAILRSIASPKPLSFDGVYAGILNVLYRFAPLVFGIASTIAATAICTVGFQTNWNVKSKWVRFDFGFLNPIGGIVKIFSIHGFINTAKAICKLALILPIGFFALKGEAPKMIQLVHTSLDSLFAFVIQEMRHIFWRIMYVLIVVAIFDYVWGKFQWFKVNKMTKHEVKDERKSIEGDEATKRKIINKGLARIMQRLKMSVPKAHVVITNPTHYAVALQYDRFSMKAPTVVAKGKGFMALRIREIAKEAGVPIIERKPLARALYASVEIGKEIPYDLYKAVAEVLAYVFKLKNPNRHAASQNATSN